MLALYCVVHFIYIGLHCTVHCALHCHAQTRSEKRQIVGLATDCALMLMIARDAGKRGSFLPECAVHCIAVYWTFLPQYKRHCDLLTPSCALWSVNSDLICTQHSTLHEHYIPHCGIHTACWIAFCEVWTTFWNRINYWRGPFCDNCKVVNLAAVESVSFRFQNIWRGKYCQKFFQFSSDFESFSIWHELFSRR